MHNSIQNREKLIKEHKWIENEKEIFGLKDHKFDFQKLNMDKVRSDNKKYKEQNDELRKRINMKADSMFEKTEN